MLEASHAALEQQVGDLAAEVCQKHLLEHPQQHLGHALGQLEDDIAGKAVADHHIHITVGHVTGLDVAHEPDARCCLEQLVGFPEHRGALALLGTVVCQRHGGCGAALHLVDIAAAHHSKGCQHLGAALHVRAAVQQQIGLVFGRHHGGQGRALYALEGAHDEACAHMERAGASGRDKGITLSLLQQVQAHHDGGILLAADGPCRLIAHLNGLGAVDQLDAVQRDIVLGSRLAHQLLAAHADDLHTVLFHSLRGAFQHSQRGVVAAHHINDNFHKRRPFLVSVLTLSGASRQLSQRESQLRPMVSTC